MPEGLSEFFSKYKLHEETQSYLTEAVQDGTVKLLNAQVEEIRQWHLDSSKKYGGDIDFDGQVKELKVPSLSSEDGIIVKVVKPRICKPHPPIIVYFHGGGFIAGSTDTDEQIVKILAKECECIFVNVEYRLAPENKFPAPFDDGKCVLRWVIMNKSLLGGVNDSKVGVLGVDVGGTIAATACHEVRGIAFQILVYPVLDLRFGQASCQEFIDCPLVSTKYLQMTSNMFLNENTESENARASPLLRSNFSQLPAALFILSDTDPVKDQAYEYKRILKDSGIDADSLLVKGSVHGFFTLPGHFKELGSKAQEKVVSYIRKRGNQ